jgi:hypothetical protein
MKIVFRLILFAVLVALGVWLWTVLFPGPEKVIRRRLLDLARTVSCSANENDLFRLAAARNVAGYFATNVELKVALPELGQRNSIEREEISQLAYAVRARAGGLQVTFPDINVTVAPDKQSAVANLTVEANASGWRERLLQEMKFTLRRVDGQWLITRIETVQTLSWSRPPPKGTPVYTSLEQFCTLHCGGLFS